VDDSHSFQLILVTTWINYDGNSYGEYDFPAWANALGWLITFSSVILIPIVATIKIYNEEGTFSYRIQKLIQPTYDWGPASPQHRRLPTTHSGYSGPIQGSNITLVTNASNSNIKDIKDTNFCQLEPLNEDFEEDTSSEDDGLNMKAIREKAILKSNSKK